jgi:K+-transporting ATPase ATPase B chain
MKKLFNLANYSRKNNKKPSYDETDSPRKKNNDNSHSKKITRRTINLKVITDSIIKLNPIYLAKNNPVMFTVEIGFVIVFLMTIFPDISETFVQRNQVFYIEVAIILLLTVWFATFSESLSEAQAKARVDSLKKLEKEVSARRIEHGKEIAVKSSQLRPGDEVRVLAGEHIPRDGLVISGKTFVDESMMTGESNPVFKEKDDHVLGGTIVTSDSLVIEITAEAGKSYLDEMVGLIQNATRPKTQNEVALTILLAGLSIIFITVIGTLLFTSHFLGYNTDIATLVALLVALMPTTIGGLLPAIGVAGITRLGKDNIIAKSGKGIEAAGDCDILILDKTGTITEGSRGAIGFIPLQGYTEEDVGQVAYAASIQDNTHEGKSIVDLAEEKKFIPPMLDKLITAKSIEFTAETRCSGVEFIPSKVISLGKEDEEELRNLAQAIIEKKETESSTVESIEETIDKSSQSKIHDMLLGMEKDLRSSNVKILKGSVDVMLELAKSNPNVNAAELNWKAQEISKKEKLRWQFPLMTR